MNLFRYKKLVVSVFFLVLLTIGVKSQAVWELGIRSGSGFYLGDQNTVLFDDYNPAYSVFTRFNVNYRWSTKFQVTTGSITSSGFDQTYANFSAIQEFSFFEYNKLRNESWSKYFSPYIFGGISIGSFTQGNYIIFAPNIPFGVGLKYKILSRVNIGLEWTMHKLFTDEFDGVDNPYENQTSLFTNKDWLSTAAVFISLDFGNRNSYCK